MEPYPGKDNPWRSRCLTCGKDTVDGDCYGCEVDALKSEVEWLTQGATERARIAGENQAMVAGAIEDKEKAEDESWEDSGGRG